MARLRQTIKEITLASAAGSPQTEYVWDAPTSSPVKNMTVFISSEGREFGTGDIEWEVYYVSKWDGTKFAEGSEPLGGICQASGIFACPTEIADHVYFSERIVPSNKMVAKYSQGATSTPLDLTGKGGAGVVLKITNADIAEEVKLIVIFESETVSDSI
jgi:hypothetical protein